MSFLCEGLAVVLVGAHCLGLWWCSCYWWLLAFWTLVSLSVAWSGRLVACFVVCLGVRFVVQVVVKRTLDWPMLLLVWLGRAWVFGLLFFFPDFPIFALASVLRPLAPWMIPEMPAETPEVAVSIKLSLTLENSSYY